jgi:ribosomal protein S18 acetylase RimI-like enzyme
MLLYLIAFFILLVCIFFIYIRLKYRFWSIQPVFHYYDLYYWIFNIGIINHELPQKNKYTNFKNIQTFEIEQLTNKEIILFTLLVQQHYFINKENKFYPKEENIINYFKGHNNPSYISFYSKPTMLYEIKTNNIIEDNKIVGVITSRPLNVSIITDNKINNFSVYYVDYLCVHKQYRKQNIAPQLIQTHEYNQRYNNQNIVVSLFKREEELTGIIPLTLYKTYCYDISNWSKSLELNPSIKLLKGDNQNIYYLYNFLKTYSNIWSIIISPEISNILELIKTNNIFVRMLVNSVSTEVEAFYIFKRTCTFISNEKEIISCIASMKSPKLTNKDFINGFCVSLSYFNKTFSYLTIENISHNYIILNSNILGNYSYIISSTYAYYFYNFAYQPFDSSKVLIIN